MSSVAVPSFSTSSMFSILVYTQICLLQPAVFLGATFVASALRELLHNGPWKKVGPRQSNGNEDLPNELRIQERVDSTVASIDRSSALQASICCIDQFVCANRQPLLSPEFWRFRQSSPGDLPFSRLSPLLLLLPSTKRVAIFYGSPPRRQTPGPPRCTIPTPWVRCWKLSKTCPLRHHPIFLPTLTSVTTFQPRFTTHHCRPPRVALTDMHQVQTLQHAPVYEHLTISGTSVG